MIPKQYSSNSRELNAPYNCKVTFIELPIISLGHLHTTIALILSVVAVPSVSMAAKFYAML